jgi:hypothetical protein
MDQENSLYVENGYVHQLNVVITNNWAHSCYFHNANISAYVRQNSDEIVNFGIKMCL